MVFFSFLFSSLKSSLCYCYVSNFGFLYIYSIWGLENLLNLWLDTFYHFWTIRDHYLFKYCFYPTASFSLGSNCIRVRPFYHFVSVSLSCPIRSIYFLKHITLITEFVPDNWVICGFLCSTHLFPLGPVSWYAWNF